MDNWENNEEIKIFREYLRIPTVQPDVDYGACVEFLQRQAADLKLPLQILYPGGPTKPIVVMTWIGKEPNLPSISLNSHMDVVPVFEDKWTHPPFGADMDAEGRIFARGAQDMKSVGMQYLGAIRALKRQGIAPKRTIHILFSPDEEIGGNLGMGAFVQSEEFKKLNIGFGLDECVASPMETFLVSYAERSIWYVHFNISGTTGHGSLLMPNTVGEKFSYILNKMMEMRKHESDRLANDTKLTLGDVTTINLTRVKGGIQSNVVPPTLEAVFDMRIPITVDHAELERKLRKISTEAGEGIELYFEQKQPKVLPTKIDASNPFWVAFKKTTDDLGLSIMTLVLPGGTDSRYLRDIGIPAIGFSPMNRTPILLHDHNEFLQADTYLRGIEIYQKLIPAVANV